MLKIHFGQLKGRKVLVPPKRKIRPALARLRFEVTDRIKEFLPGARVLDLYAGTGIFGFEALSSGAQFVMFVDKSKQSKKYILKNAERFGIPKNKFDVWVGDVVKALIKLKRRNQRYDIVFVDPPYDILLSIPVERQQEYLLELLDRILDVLDTKGIIVLKLHKKIRFKMPKALAIFERRRYGINVVYILVLVKDVLPQYRDQLLYEQP